MTSGKWRFWIDRGGTFTDVVACNPARELSHMKLLSSQPTHYKDACIEAIRRLMKVPADTALPAEQIQELRMGTTVATNALLERKGTPTALFVTRGFKDALEIGYQNRPELFALDIRRLESLYDAVFEIDERIGADGKTVTPLDMDA
ncbi:MAG TPA: 5-oxoprolinase, partial [Myxococcales bacterium]|nr:5-oxoprolinase [Myxococcales bacterium]